jgi:hypothetical protein
MFSYGALLFKPMSGDANFRQYVVQKSAMADFGYTSPVYTDDSTRHLVRRGNDQTLFAVLLVDSSVREANGLTSVAKLQDSVT